MSRRCRPIALLSLSMSLFAALHAHAAGELYVSAEDGGDVAVVDPARGEVVARIHVGKRPRGLKLAPDGKLLYVALSGSPKGGPGVDESKLPPPDRSADGIGVVDVATRKLVRTIPSGQDPESFDLSRDGKTLYVSNEETAEMTALRPAGGKLIRRVKVGGEPEGVTVRPDGKVVYVTSEQENEVFAIDTKKLEVLARIATAARPRAVAFTRDGKKAFVTCENAATVTIVDAMKNVATGEVKIEQPFKTALGPRPMGAALSPDGATLYVSTGRGESVAVIDVATGKLARVIGPVGARPWGIAVSSDGKRIYTANGPSNDVSVVDVASGKVENHIKVEGAPWGVVLAR